MDKPQDKSVLQMSNKQEKKPILNEFPEICQSKSILNQQKLLND